MTLSGRPLLGNSRDTKLFVNRRSELTQLERALKLGLNVAVVGQAGSGKTSLLNALSYEKRDEFTFVMRSSDGAKTAAELLERMTGTEPLADAAGLHRFVRQVMARDALDSVVEWGAQLEAKEDKPVVFVIDALSPELGRELFGAMRDELWAAQIQWIVTLSPHAAGTFLQPPVDAFFESRVDVENMDPSASEQLIRLRTKALSDDVVKEIAASANRNPRALLDFVRFALQNDEQDLDKDLTARDVAIAHLEPTSRAVVDALASGEPKSASDPELASQLGLTRSRISQVLNELEGLGVVRRTTPKTRTPGRPKIVFQLVPPQDYAGPRPPGSGTSIEGIRVG